VNTTPHRAGRTACTQAPDALGVRSKGKQMFDKKTVSIEWGGQTLTLETGKVARQADGAIMATLGETVVLCAVTAAKTFKEWKDFYTMTVNNREKYSSS
jgi:polyribonucleotide nucleotidyltransferase